VTLVEIHRHHTDADPGRRALTFLARGEEVEALSRGDLDRRALVLGRHLAERWAVGVV
jgi:hypothetical protein